MFDNLPQIQGFTFTGCISFGAKLNSLCYTIVQVRNFRRRFTLQNTQDVKIDRYSILFSTIPFLKKLNVKHKHKGNNSYFTSCSRVASNHSWVSQIFPSIKMLGKRVFVHKSFSFGCFVFGFVASVFVHKKLVVANYFFWLVLHLDTHIEATTGWVAKY